MPPRLPERDDRIGTPLTNKQFACQALRAAASAESVTCRISLDFGVGSLHVRSVRRTIKERDAPEKPVGWSFALLRKTDTRRIAYLRDGDWSVITRHGAEMFDAGGRAVPFEIKQTALIAGSIGKDSYRHYMEKELHEHPLVIGQTLQHMIDPTTRRVVMLINGRVSVVAIAPSGRLFDKIASNLQEARARRPPDGVHRCARRRAAARHRRGDRGAAGGGRLHRPDPAQHLGADAGLRGNAAERHRCGPAAQPGESVTVE